MFKKQRRFTRAKLIVNKVTFPFADTCILCKINAGKKDKVVYRDAKQSISKIPAYAAHTASVTDGPK